MKPGSVRRRLSITLAILVKLREVSNKSLKVQDPKMLWATCCLCFFGFLRSGKIVAPAVAQERTDRIKVGCCKLRFCTLKELKSLVGKLQHACKVVRPGRTFMRYMFELMKGARKGQRFLRLNSAFKSDLAWWHLFMEQWNGTLMLFNLGQASPRYHLFSDASDIFGCGAWWEAQWFQLPWP